MPIQIAAADDFALSGRGDHPAWSTAVPYTLPLVQGVSAYATEVRALYSPTGLYVLFDCEDSILTADLTEPFSDLYTQDVVEVFLKPEEGLPVYFEYELSPLDVELALMMVAHENGRHGWLPFHYDGARRTRHATAIRGRQASGAACTGWSAEMFIPYALLLGLPGLPPKSGHVWRVNFCRLDYDGATDARWALAHSPEEGFHATRAYDTLQFI